MYVSCMYVIMCIISGYGARDRARTRAVEIMDIKILV